MYAFDNKKIERRGRILFYEYDGSSSDSGDESDEEKDKMATTYKAYEKIYRYKNKTKKGKLFFKKDKKFF